MIPLESEETTTDELTKSASEMKVKKKKRRGKK